MNVGDQFSKDEVSLAQLCIGLRELGAYYSNVTAVVLILRDKAVMSDTKVTNGVQNLALNLLTARDTTSIN